VSDAPAFAAETDAWVSDALARLERVPALALTVVVDDEVVLARAWGTADRETGTPADGRTQFYIASATKPFTGLLAAMLDAAGEVDLDSPLAGHLHGAALDPALKPAEVKLRDLLTHTSGIENGPIGFRVAFSGEHDPGLLWSLLDDSVPAENAPLGTYKYTNVGYNIYTMISDRETGKRWQDQLRDRIFAPLGMERTTAYVTLGRAKGWPGAAPYFAFGREGLQRVPLEKTDETMQSAGGLLSTAEDLGRWLRFQMAGGRLDGRQVVDAAVLRATHEALVSAEAESGSPFGQSAYGLGWSHGSFRERSVLSHGGGFSGFRSVISFAPDERIGVAAMVNEGSIGSMLLETAVGAAYDWWLGTAEGTPQEDVEQLVQRMAMFADRMKADYGKRDQREWMLARPRTAYAGTYVSELFGTVVVAERDGRLEVTQGNLHCVAEPFTQEETARVELIPGSGHVIVFEPAEGAVERIRLDGDEYARVE
jgi:CubicO group peptidase (beta-lactamase class C family)